MATPGHMLNSIENLGSLKSFPKPTGKGSSCSPPRKFRPWYQIWSTKGATNKDWKNLFEVFEPSELSEFCLGQILKKEVIKLFPGCCKLAFGFILALQAPKISQAPIGPYKGLSNAPLNLWPVLGPCIVCCKAAFSIQMFGSCQCEIWLWLQGPV